jgi:hypothetical protein
MPCSSPFGSLELPLSLVAAAHERRSCPSRFPPSRAFLCCGAADRPRLRPPACERRLPPPSTSARPSSPVTAGSASISRWCCSTLRRRRQRLLRPSLTSAWSPRSSTRARHHPYSASLLPLQGHPMQHAASSSSSRMPSAAHVFPAPRVRGPASAPLPVGRLSSSSSSVFPRTSGRRPVPSSATCTSPFDGSLCALRRHHMCPSRCAFWPDAFGFSTLCGQLHCLYHVYLLTPISCAPSLSLSLESSSS